MSSVTISNDLFDVDFDEQLEKHGGGKLSKERLREYVYERARDTLNKLHPDWLRENKITKDAFRRLCEINVRIDLSKNLAQIVNEFSAQESTRSDELIAIDNEHKNEVRRFFFDSNDVCGTVDVNSKTYRGGQTLLHVEACKGNMDAVVDLVENRNADIAIVDNSGMTAEQACFYMGRINIANYLKSRRLRS